jgi:hypothetical protein
MSGSDQILRSLAEIAPQQRDALRISFVRELDPGDELIPAQRPAPVLREMKAAHHQLARLIASGKPLVDVALITGHSVGYCYSIQKDPGFQELLDHYAVVDELALMDIAGQMMAVGVDALAILRDRQTTEPEKFSIGQLQEQVKLLLVGPSKLAGEGPGASSPSGISVTFVNAPAAPELKTIAASPRRED